ncbi:MAG TPA: DUF2784 domain-containing protein [Candidatus Angelobacter sp.]|nr:DUF2784 domain-containing protein [Candidatus Angelobacter sp.]
MYVALAILVLIVHALFILWVIFGALLTRGRPLYAGLHITSFVWGLLIEILPWSCPLTLAENWFEMRAGIAPYQGGFVLHYLDALVYPNVPPLLLIAAASVVFAANVAIYARRWLAQ